MPVDLVGHDWGCLFVQRVVSVRPDLIRTWGAGNGPIDREYVWHDLAQQWQTPGVGEAIMAMMGGDALAEGLAAAGVPAEDARTAASHMDERMKECILGLYRSAVRVGERVRGELVFLEGCGHWWPLEHPAEAAAALERFWRAHA